MPATLADINEALQKAGLTPRGAFHPKPEDGVPDFASCRPVMTLVLAGNAGPTMWAAFSAAASIGLELESRHTGYGGFQQFLETR